MKCEASCHLPKQWGHVCYKDKHPRTESHVCGYCGLIWSEPTEQ